MGSLAKNVARDHIDMFSLGGAAVSVVPVPGFHSAALTLAEAKMAADIAGIYGLKATGAVWKLILNIIMLKLGGSAALKLLAESLNFLPGFGWIAKPLVATSTIKLFGESLIIYFEDLFPSQIAFHKPSWDSLVMAFGESIVEHELVSYFNSFGDTTTDGQDTFNSSDSDNLRYDYEQSHDYIDSARTNVEAANDLSGHDKIYFCNDCSKKIETAIHYKDLNNRWKTVGWWALDPGQEAFVARTRCTTFFDYARSYDSAQKTVWRGDDFTDNIRGSIDKYGFSKSHIKTTKWGTYTVHFE